MAKEIKLPFSNIKGTLDETPIEPTIEITENGTHNVKGYVYADVNVEGGSSDFSTATVTIKLGETSIDYTEYAVLHNNLYDDDGIWVIESSNLNPPTSPETTKTVVLYQGVTHLFNNMSENAIESVEGNIEYDDDNAWYVITGDCTVTVAGEGAQ